MNAVHIQWIFVPLSKRSLFVRRLDQLILLHTCGCAQYAAATLVRIIWEKRLPSSNIILNVKGYPCDCRKAATTWYKLALHYNLMVAIQAWTRLGLFSLSIIESIAFVRFECISSCGGAEQTLAGACSLISLSVIFSTTGRSLSFRKRAMASMSSHSRYGFWIMIRAGAFSAIRTIWFYGSESESIYLNVTWNFHRRIRCE